MGAFFYVVAIMGCGDGGNTCRDARVLQSRYATAAECSAALPARLAENTDLPFPSIGADCRPQGLRMASASLKTRG